MTGSMVPPRITVEPLATLVKRDVLDLCDAAESAITAGGGFGWLKPPKRDVMESYWRGVVLVPERQLFVGRLDGVIAAALQLVRTPRNNEAQAHSGALTGLFVAPWARGHGLARSLAELAERAAREGGLRVLNLDLRATQTAAVVLFEALGYRRWGTHPFYAHVDGAYVAGHFYTKELQPPS